MKMFVMATIMKTFHKLHRRQLDWKCLTRVAFAMTAVCLLSALLLHVNLNRETFNRSSVDETRFQEYDLVGRLLGRDLSLENSNYLCPRNNVLRSSRVNILGRYPTRSRHLTIGITSITRPTGTSYLLKTIQSLLVNMNDVDKTQTFIVVFLADLNEALKYAAAKDLARNFRKEIEENLLHVIEAFPQYYPQLSKLKLKFGDSEDRTKWRSKQNIDFAFLMCYCQDLSDYYLHLEDDIIASPSVFPKLHDFISSQEKPWPILDVSALGHVAKVYHSKDLGNIASYFYLMYDEMPVDLLIGHWREIKNPANVQFIGPAASLFQHEGIRSSLKEKEWLLNQSYDRYFDLYDHKYKGLNPPASVLSSIPSSKGNPQDAYRSGIEYFWGKQIKVNDSVTVKFHSVVNIKQVFVDTGSNLAVKDWLNSGVLQASFLSRNNKMNAQMHGTDTSSCGHFETIAPFEQGRANITFDKFKKTCVCVLQVTKENTKL
ncbi:hypothetical protein ACROYT_G028057 [Oculina patagonica]